MKKIPAFIFLFYFQLNFLVAQNETNNWYFGYNVGLNFLTSPPSPISLSAMQADEGSASVSDNNGNLLFYTNGITVWNSAHTTMANGTGLIASWNAAQSSLIVKKPGSQNLYYLFTQGALGSGPLAYSIIDMSLAAGMGSVTIKNATISLNTTEKLCATKHCNGTDYWIMSHAMNSNNFLAYQLSSSGINTVAVISSVGSIHSSGGGGVNAIGYMKFSPNGRKLGTLINGNNQVEMFDFDPGSGVVTNSLSLGINYHPYGCEFSPDGTKFYSSVENLASSPTHFQIIQWDLCAGSQTAIVSSRSVVASELINTAALYGLQLGKDGKLYVAISGQPKVNVIQYPNLAGSASSYTTGPSLGTGTMSCTFGLPNFVSNYFREKPVFTSSTTCSSTSFSTPVFFAGTGYSVVSQSWSFGDAASGASNTSTLANPSHMYSAGGTYTAALILHYDCGTDTLKQVVNITVPGMTLTGKTTICSQESTTLNVSGANTYSWSNGVMTNTASFSPTATTVYTVVGTSTTTSCSSSKVVTVTVNPCTGIYESVENEKLVSLYPNPNKGVFTIQALTPTTQVIIYDQLGTKVYEAIITTSTHKLDLSHLAAGIYFVNASNKEKSSSLKFVKME